MLQLKKEELEYEIIGEDERRLVRNTKEAPFRWICCLELVFGKHIYRGTGTLIGERWILTAGHCLFDHEHHLGAVTEVKIIPAKNGVAEPFGSAKMLRFNVDEKWRKNADMEYDYGLVTIDKSLGSELRWWKRIRSLETNQLRDLPINIAGYPVDKCGINPPKGSLSKISMKACPRNLRATTMWMDFKRIKEPQIRLLFYNLDTIGGMSGSPIWVRWKEYRSIIGIHTGAWNINKNRGIRVTEDIMQHIRSWMK